MNTPAPEVAHARAELAAAKRHHPTRDHSLLEGALEEAKARRAVDDPALLGQAARIVRAALARQRLRIEDLAPLPADGGTAA